MKSASILRRACSFIAVLTAAGAALVARAEATVDAPEGGVPPLPTVVRVDPAAMPKATVPGGPLGLRYSELSGQEAKALRRGFKLPLDALAKAQSTADLLRAAKSAPLPDPSHPLLSVSGTDSVGKANPFAGSGTTSFRSDPMKALGEMLAAVDGADPSEAATASEEDPFGGDAAFQAGSTSDTGAEDDVEAEVDNEDPFASDADPFGGDEDPFGDF